MLSAPGSGRSRGRSSEQELLSIYEQARKWQKFDNTPGYQEQRKFECDLLGRITEALTPRESAKLLVKSDRLIFEKPKAPALESALATALGKSDRAAAELALERFGVNKGVDGLWGSDGDVPERRVAFDPASAFHDQDHRSQLADIASSAATAPTIQGNFLTYLRMLLHGALEVTGSFSRDRCKELLGDEELVKVVWAAAVARPLNLRTMGSLREQLLKVKAIGIDPDRVEPEWWTTMEESGRTRRRGLSSR